MNENPKELSLEESAEQIMKTLPLAIRTYIIEERYAPVVKNLTFKYQLHIDQAGILERELLLLLMGIEASEEFTNSLAEIGRIENQKIGGIIQDINEQIFIPLRKKEEEQSAANQNQKTQSPQLPSAPKVSTDSHAPITAPERELPIGDEPSVAVMKTNEVPTNLPGAMQPQQTPEMPKPATVAASQTPPPPQVGPKPKIKVPSPNITSYASDPYREPIDDHGKGK